MIDQRHEELASLYALDLLEGEERASFETALAANPALQKLVTELRTSSATLAHLASATPRRELKEKVLASIATEHAPRPPPNAKLMLFRTIAPWTMAALFAVVGVWLAQTLSATRGELQLVRTEAEIANLSLQSARNLREAEQIVTQKQIFDLNARTNLARQSVTAGAATVAGGMSESNATALGLANLRITTLTSAAGNSGEAAGVAVWSPEHQAGILQLAKLPPPPVDKVYQLWLMTPQYPSPVDGGVLTVTSDGALRTTFKAKQPVDAIDGFTITLEQKSGSPKPDGSIVLRGN